MTRFTGQPPHDTAKGVRNIAIIAHVDHGKTTLVDQMLWQSGTFRENQRVAERVLDNIDLERERGITVLSKCASVTWSDVRINIVDTPGHADFGGEVERILDMVDGVVILVDAAEGPMPQTRFVTMKALSSGLHPIVVVNKMDRPDARAREVEEEIFDLFVTLEASDDQLDFRTLFASARQGWAVEDPEESGQSLSPLFEQVITRVPAPQAEVEGSFAMLCSILEYDPFLGRVLTGRIERGLARVNSPVVAVDQSGATIETARLTRLLSFRGIERVPVTEAHAGDIVAIAGLRKASVTDTIADPELDTPVKARPIDPPTLAMYFSVNDSPLAGQDGDKVTSRMLGDRLFREAEGNVAVSVARTDDETEFEVRGRGELQLGILIETMRREGYEFSVSRPRVLFRGDPDSGQRSEPVEEVTVDLDSGFVGTVVEAMSQRRAEMTDMHPLIGGQTRLVFLAPTRGLIGYHGQFLNDTRGTGVMSRVFHGYAPDKGQIPGRRNGVLVSNTDGKSVPFALWNLEDRGVLFIGGGTEVYEGMIIGEHNRGNDLVVNPLRTKKLTNIRAAGSDDAVRLTPPLHRGLEEAIGYIEDDELVEVTPRHVRLRKRHLDPHVRKRAEHKRVRAATG